MPNYLQTQQGQIEYVLNRSRRRSLAIRINRQAQVSVHAPTALSMSYIERFLLSKSDWIIEKSRKVQKDLAYLNSRKFAEGQEFLFLGRKFKMEFSSSIHQDVLFDGQKWVVRKSPASFIREKMVEWYRGQAQEMLAGRVFHFARIMDVEPLKVVVRTQKHLWGSCHPFKKSIHLNWQIIMAPLRVVDYVIVHELAHLFVANHSKRFWKKVETIMPDYKKCRQWLKDNALDMMLPNEDENRH